MSPLNPGLAPEKDVLVTADVVVCSVIDGRLCLLLGQMKEPAVYNGWWKLPGAPLAAGKTAEETARLALASHVDLERAHFEQLGEFDAVGRDPERRAVSVAHLALVPAGGAAPDGAGEYRLMQWRMPGALPKLAYDHALIIKAALKRLNDRLSNSGIAASLLPGEFTLTELQQLYESILGRDLDTRNFRKKMLASGLLKETGTKRQAAHRPAALYRFATKTKTFLDLP
jgi:8-oxo-dGTP diphosphatase